MNKLLYFKSHALETFFFFFKCDKENFGLFDILKNRLPLVIKHLINYK